MLRKWLLAGIAAISMVAVESGPAAAGKQQDQGGQITQFYGVDGGPIDPFYGPINPFYGGIYPFYGQISPFWGDIAPFWGTINPFYGTIQPFFGNIDPFWGTINPFSANQFLQQVFPYWNLVGPQWGALNTTWNDLQASGANDYTAVQAGLNAFVATTVLFWGDQAGQYVQRMYEKYGIDPSDQQSLAYISPEQRSAFFMNLYDNLMNFSYIDHVDWWMGAVHWGPQLVQTQGPGTMPAGLLDASIARNYSDVKDLKFVGGYQGYVNDHGAAVASLMAAMRDNIGVMGVAPNSSVRLYNPFDSSGTAGWKDVANGIDRLYKQKATVVNASLGIPGWTLSSEWGTVLTSETLSSKKHGFALVKAAGNEATVQTKDISWPSGYSAPTNIIMAGSVGPTGQISQFSNTPGEACILVNGICQEQNKLKYRFIVAPGELMLVEDNQGGTTRMTGTSFSAPLVTGTIALLQTRWPWLQQYADESVQIVLQSATDLGDPGVDPVYGWGMLNVEAAQSPLNFDNMIVFQPMKYNNGKDVKLDKNHPNWTAAQFKAALKNPVTLLTWELGQMYVVGYENVGLTYRDFNIPLSSQLIGKTQSVNGAKHPFQSYIYERLLDWAQHTAGRHKKGKRSAHRQTVAARR
ncbi:MAG: S8 family serine peptidase [Alphaproteobacteria bacterium]|nr:S8 family serine peptidase [Alphaproteobacteria bacterium]